jgi:hypothetical protein
MSTYPLDVTGLAVTNRITNQTIPIVPGDPDITGSAPYILLPYAPFHANNFVITHGSTPLIRGQHYDFIGQHIHALRYIGKELFGGVYFYNRNISGTVTVSYNTIGSVYVQNNYQHMASFFNSYFSQQMVNWDRVFGVPALLPPLNSPTPLSSLKGVDDIVSAIEVLTSAVEDSDSGPLTTAINNLVNSLVTHTNNRNAHGTTKADVGLDLVGNFGVLDSLNNSFTGVGRYMLGGSTGHTRIAQQILAQPMVLTNQDPLTTVEFIFQSSSLADITLPSGSSTGDIEKLIILQIRLPSPGVNTTRTDSLNLVERLQIGFATTATSSDGFIVIRRLLPGASGSQPWSVLPSWSMISDLF